MAKYIPYTRLSLRHDATVKERTDAQAARSGISTGGEQENASDLELLDFNKEISLVITQARAEGAHQIATRLEAAVENQRLRQDDAT